MYFIAKGTLKTANKQYSTVNNDYEMTFNSDTSIEICEDEVDLPSITFDFVKLNELESKQPNTTIGLSLFMLSCNNVVSYIIWYDF